ncbi:MFS transporter [Bradyrhizobium sp. Tv2a-2]|uniref:MFS transporter n=1 Tax=Bradyrhizobium sp. Tv2a-2 TaxID=113395 RepID=UPI0003FBC4BE|nr:MFS transporter [Bradyrhizobium sp. Tv2a-2]
MSAISSHRVDGSAIAAGQLPLGLRYQAFAPLLVASVVIAAAYGTSFLLPDYMQALGKDSEVAGAIISRATAAIILCCFLAGWMAQRVGIMPTVTGASLAMALAMLLLAGAGLDERAAYAGGMLVGVGWSVSFILLPLQIIRHLRPAARLQYLTILSGSQMAGLGLATPFGHLLARCTGSMSVVYALFATACVIAALCLEASRRAMVNMPTMPMPHIEITAACTVALLRKCTAVPIAMITVAACIFSGLSTYQSAYAASRHLNSDLFFLVFTAASVALRFSVALAIGRVPVHRLALTLMLATGASLVLFLVNTGSTSLYITATAIFAVGYGLSYATLNGMAVNLADGQGLSVPVTSQMFSLAYFLGLFGFPLLGGQLIRGSGPDVMLLTLLGATATNAVLAIASRKYCHKVPLTLRKELAHAD